MAQIEFLLPIVPYYRNYRCKLLRLFATCASCRSGTCMGLTRVPEALGALATSDFGVKFATVALASVAGWRAWWRVWFAPEPCYHVFSIAVLIRGLCKKFVLLLATSAYSSAAPTQVGQADRRALSVVRALHILPPARARTRSCCSQSPCLCGCFFSLARPYSRSSAILAERLGAW